MRTRRVHEPRLSIAVAGESEDFPCKNSFVFLYGKVIAVTTFSVSTRHFVIPHGWDTIFFCMCSSEVCRSRVA